VLLIGPNLQLCIELLIGQHRLLCIELLIYQHRLLCIELLIYLHLHPFGYTESLIVLAQGLCIESWIAQEVLLSTETQS
jgi:hypothetical protein